MCNVLSVLIPTVSYLLTFLLVHVDQFKQELGREVMSMAEEVGRLQRERQHVEAQISDMYSFYSKHKQGDLVRFIS